MPLVRTEHIWQCDNCGKEGAWGPTWRSLLILHTTPGPWDEQLIACSAECADAIDEKRHQKQRMGKS